jgi:hypothetical protein
MFRSITNSIKRSQLRQTASLLLTVLIGLAAIKAVAQKAPQPDAYEAHPRLVVISDIGNEPDDQMSFLRLLLYSNQLDLEAMVATTSTWQKSTIHPETMHELVKGYGAVRDNLLLHAKGWPLADELDKRVHPGQSGYGMAATGAGRSTEGSDALVAAIEKVDARPLWITLWGGANTLAQALIDLRARHTTAEVEALVNRLRVYSISDQDDAGPWIRNEFPGLYYIVQPTNPDSQDYLYATWTGISGDMYYRNAECADTSLVTNEWLDKNIRSKGSYGKLYPRFLFIMEGDTPSYLNLIDNGLAGAMRPDFGGWGGRYMYRQPRAEPHAIWTQGGDEFFRVTSQDEVVGKDGHRCVSDQATVYRWREAYQNDFAARMDWTVKDFAHANHAPLVKVNGIEGTAPVELQAKAGDVLRLDAAGTTDPDGQKLHYHWFVYSEAGRSGVNGANVALASEEEQQATLTVKSACREAWLAGIVPCKGEGVAHIILAVTDEGTPKLTAYRRVIVHVTAPDDGQGK